jgi:hypothetical protein
MPEIISTPNRWNTDELLNTKLSKEPRLSSLSPKNSLYYSTCFLKLQNEIDQAFIKIIKNESNFPKLKTLKSFPYQVVESAAFVTFSAYFIPMFFVLSMIFPALMLIKVRIH